MVPEEHAPQEQGKKPAFYILTIFLVLLLVISIFPYYSIKYDPHPDQIPEYGEVVKEDFVVSEAIFNYSTKADYRRFVNASDPVIKRAANNIVLLSGCKESKVCNAKAIYYFVRDHMRYVADPTTYEYIQTPREALRTRTGDCDDASVILSNLLQAIGIPTRFVFVPRHVYVQAKIPDAPKKYQREGWINLDPTCKRCAFGEIPGKRVTNERRFIEP